MSRTMSEMPTIVDIAKALGVSHSTVSRAFTAPHRLRAETVQRVRTKAAEMGYVPNRSAKALSTGRPGVIGVLVPDITNPFFPPMIRAAQRAAERHDVAVYVGESDNDPERELHLLDRFEHEVEGFVIASSRLSEAALLQVTDRVDSVLVNRDIPGVRRILLSAADALCHALADHADSHPGRVHYVGGPHRSWSEAERRAAVTDSCAQLGLDLDTHACHSGTYDEGYEIGGLLHPAGGDLVVAFDDVIAHGLFDALSGRGVAIPAEVRMLGCDGALPVRTSPRLPTIRLAAADAGRRAVQMLLGDVDVEERSCLPGQLTAWPEGAC